MRLTFMTALVALTASTGAFAADVTLRVHHFLSADAPIQKGVLEPWEKTIEEQSGGRIDVQLYPSMQLGGKPQQLFDQASDGIVDISWTLLGYTPGRFPVSEAFELPFMAGTAMQTTMALQAYQEKHMAREMRRVHTLMLHAPSAYKFHLTKAGVDSLDKLAGMKIRTPSRTMTEGLNALGATAVGMPVPEVAQSLSTGVLDGAVLPWEVVGSLRLASMTGHHLEIGRENGGIATSVMALVMNRSKYDSLPDDLKKIIDDNSGMALAKLAGEAFDKAEQEQRDKALAEGSTITIIPEADLAAWKEAVAPAIDEWVKNMDRNGHDGQALLDDARAMLEAAMNE